MRPDLRFACLGVATLTASILLLSPSPRATSGAVRGGGPVETEITWETLRFPASIRDQVYRTAASVPAYPMNDQRLRKAKHWPDTIRIGGVLCSRRIHGREDDDAFALQSLDDADVGTQITLFYDHMGSRWNNGNAGWGPQYSWDRKKRLTQRIWYEPDSTRLARQDYSYYKDGRLLGYSWRIEPRRRMRDWSANHEFLTQFFDRDGKLVAVCYEKMRPGSRDSLYVWRGEELPFDRFRMKTHAFYSAGH